MSQTHKKMEVLFVVDSRSKDNSIEIAKKACLRLGNSRVIVQDDNMGLGGARNIGLDHSSGDLICFTDVDDGLLPEYLEELVKAQKETNAEIVTCDGVWSTSVGNSYKKKACTSETLTRDEGILFLGSGDIPVNTWCKLFVRDFLLKNNLYFIKGYHEDADHSYRSFSKATTICRLKCPLYIYYQHESSICGKNKGPMAEGSLKVYGDLRDFFSKENGSTYEIYRRSSLKNLLHCISLAEWEEYQLYSQDKRIKEDAKDFKFKSPEFLLFSISPRVYYKLANIVRKIR